MFLSREGKNGEMYGGPEGQKTTTFQKTQQNFRRRDDISENTTTEMLLCFLKCCVLSLRATVEIYKWCWSPFLTVLGHVMVPHVHLVQYVKKQHLFAAQNKTIKAKDLSPYPFKHDYVHFPNLAGVYLATNIYQDAFRGWWWGVLKLCET